MAKPPPPPAAERGRRTRLAPELQRDRILRSATAVFAEVGYANTTMGLLATRAGVTRTLLYHYFASKEMIFETALQQGLEQLEPIVARLGDNDQPLAEQLRGLFDSYHATMAEHPEVVRLCVDVASLPDTPLSPEYERRISSLRAHLLHWVEARRPQLRPGVDGEQFLFLVFGALTLWFLPTPFGRALGAGGGVADPTGARHREAMCDLLLHGLLGPGPADQPTGGAAGTAGSAPA